MIALRGMFTRSVNAWRIVVRIFKSRLDLHQCTKFGDFTLDRAFLAIKYLSFDTCVSNFILFLLLHMIMLIMAASVFMHKAMNYAWLQVAEKLYMLI